MSRRFTLIREDSHHDGTDHYISVFEVAGRIDDPEEAIRKAIDAFVETEDFEDALRSEGIDYEHFNWGDAILHVPDEIWEDHGLMLADRTEDAVSVVNHNEQLVHEEPEHMWPEEDREIYGEGD